MWQLIPMIVGAAMSANAQASAAARQQAAAVASQKRMLAARNQATDEAMKRVQEFDAEGRNTKQDQIAQQLTTEYDTAAQQPAITAQGVQVGQTVPSGGTVEYITGKAKEQARVKDSLHRLAQLMGRTGAPGQLRRNEAVGIGDTAGAIGRIQTGANNIAGIDQVGIQAAGQPNIGQMLVGSALMNYGMGSAISGGVGGGVSGTNDMGLFAKLGGAGKDPMGWWLRNGVGAD